PRVAAWGLVSFGLWRSGEFGGRGGFWRRRVQGLEYEAFVFVEQVNAAVAPGAHEDFVLGPGQGRVELENLEAALLVRDGPVVGERAVFVGAEHVAQVEVFEQGAVEAVRG